MAVTARRRTSNDFNINCEEHVSVQISKDKQSFDLGTVCKLRHGGQAFILIIGGLMQEVMPVPNEGTLNSNIAK